MNNGHRDSAEINLELDMLHLFMDTPLEPPIMEIAFQQKGKQKTLPLMDQQVYIVHQFRECKNEMGGGVTLYSTLVTVVWDD